MAARHRRELMNRAFKATSPNGRFTEGARQIDQQPLRRVEAHGKNLFYFFGNPKAPTVVHVHFGMSGRWTTSKAPGPEPRPACRLQLESKELGTVTQLSAQLLQHGGLDYYAEKAAKLGPDPLREDADKEKVWAAFQNRKREVGWCLMEQSIMAGGGNIYRAEILYKSGVHPDQPANTVSRAKFELIWKHSVLLLQRGFKTGSILTVDPADAQRLGEPWTRRYIYGQTKCGECGTKTSVYGECRTAEQGKRGVAA